MSTKEAVIRIIEKLPKNASLSDIMAKIYFKQKVDKGLEQLRHGHGISHDQVKTRLKKWLA